MLNYIVQEMNVLKSSTTGVLIVLDIRIMWGNTKLYRVPKSTLDLLNKKNIETKTKVCQVLQEAEAEMELGALKVNWERGLIPVKEERGRK